MSKVYVETHDMRNIEAMKTRFEEFLAAPFHNVEEVEDWLKQVSDYQDELREALDGHYIEFQTHNQDTEIQETYQFDQEHVLPLLKRYEAQLDQKLLSSPHELDNNVYGRLIRSKETAAELYREENIDLEVKEDRLATRYFELTGALTAEWEGEQLTIPQLFPLLEDPDRTKRKKVYDQLFGALSGVEEELQAIMDELMVIREQKAANSGLANYRDYMFKKYNRFDYTPEDCKELADSIREHVVPAIGRILSKKAEELGVESIRPYDHRAVPLDEEPLRPFKTGDELVAKTGRVLGEISPRFSELLHLMDSKGLLDLETRKNKSPGGFCESLPVSGLSFIFMNASGTHGDVTTLIHEMGHCIHNDFKRTLPLAFDRATPMESAELASMGMELLSMDHWDHYYSEEQVRQAKLDMLRDIIQFFPSGIWVDEFQHWMYENPGHSKEERSEAYGRIVDSYLSSEEDWSGYEEVKKKQWLFVLHIFEVPFYYIEYVIAQLGALQLYRIYKEDPDRAIEGYKEALRLGNTASLSDVYEAAGLSFDFSADMIKGLVAFVEKEIAELEGSTVKNS
ncbi:M3 family oligoendopeptidase [Rossellomorea marisflavi]|uniref:M3 family oligoendopeptidase n=1 Tax=Rossellomorea marisflavi TaxID=189381 RepID=UPI00279F8FF4|nr:M3 family oligoendopeptidase [Rossellomorea marisflavi]UTE73825.1 M3 family oligoendopeptidase [Rossellomorea marisflavi]